LRKGYNEIQMFFPLYGANETVSPYPARGAKIAPLRSFRFSSVGVFPSAQVHSTLPPPLANERVDVGETPKR